MATMCWRVSSRVRVVPWVAMLGVEEELSAEDMVVVTKKLLVSELGSSSC